MMKRKQRTSSSDKIVYLVYNISLSKDKFVNKCIKIFIVKIDNIKVAYSQLL
jgi:hypothetical protein